MPYSITTRDGITIADIPDDIPADHPSLRERVAAIRGQKAPAAGPDTAPSAAKGGILGGLFMGLRDPIDAGAQLLARGVDAGVRGVNSLTGLDLPRPDVANVDRIVNTANAEREQSRQMAGNGGFDGWRLVGNIANPVNLVGGWSAAAAKTLPQLAVRGAQAGAIGAATQPVVGETSDFWSQKAAQAGTGALAGAVATPLLSKGLEAAGTALKAGAGMVQRGAAKATATPERINVTVTNVLNAAGVAPADITDAMRDSIKAQVQQALAAGQKLDPKALVRQAQAEAVGLTDDAALTLGQRTRDPMQFAREQNLSGVNLQGPQGAGNPLSTRFAEQNKRLGEVFGSAGAREATDRVTAGQSFIDALRAADVPARAAVDDAYAAARAMNNGRAAELERGTFSQMANSELDRGMWGHFVPPEVRSLLNSISDGSTPFNVETSVQIDSILAKAQRKAERAGDDAGASAVGVIRTALHDTPLAGGAPAAQAPGTGAGAGAGVADTGEAARTAFDRARGLARDRFKRIESTPAMAAALDDAAPDRFVQQYLIGAPVRDVQALRKALESNPSAMQQARAQVAAALRRAAFGENTSEDKLFAPERYAKTLEAIGPQKLAVFFTPQEVVRLNLVGKVASDTLTTPAGAQRAVNYSNSGAAVMNLLGSLSESPLMRNLPGARMIANQVGEIKTEREIGRALSPQAPKPSADLSPEALRALRLLLPPGAVGLGAAVGSTSQP